LAAVAVVLAEAEAWDEAWEQADGLAWLPRPLSRGLARLRSLQC